jgi:hypothetical protein
MKRLTAAVIAALSMTAAQTAAAAREPGAQRWLVLTRPGEPTHVVATGAVNALGTVQDSLALNFITATGGTFDNYAAQTYPDGTLNYHGRGTFTLTVNQRSCIGEGDVVGSFVIEGGTGAYAGATGTGTALISLRFFFEETATGCSQVPVRTYGVAQATGTLIIPS